MSTSRRVVTLIAVLASTACGTREVHRAKDDRPRVGGRLVIGVQTEPRDLDQATQLAFVENYVSTFLGSGLVTIAPDGRIVAAVARSWESSPDGKRLTFHLRDDVRYASGRRLVAGDFAATIERILAPATASPVRDLLQGVTAVHAPDDATLVLDLDKPNFDLLVLIADLQPAEPQALARWGAAYGQHPSSVGPYRLKRIRSGESVLLERNPDYRWAPEFVHQGPWCFREIEFRVLAEPAAQVAALESGEVTMLFALQPSSWAAVRRHPDVRIVEVPSRVNAFLEINLEDPVLADVRVRRAIQHALDRQAIIDGVWEGHGTVGYGAVHPAARGALAAIESAPLARPYDVGAARRLLDEAGWRDTDGDHVREQAGRRLELTLTVGSGGADALEAELIQAQLRAVGIETRIEVLEAHSAWEKAQRGDYQLALDGNVAAPDAALTLALTLSSSQIGSGLNFSRYRSAEVDELLRRARETTSEREHLETTAEVQRIFARDAVYATIGYPTRGIAVRRSVRGARPHPLFPVLILDDAWLAEGER